MGDPVQLGAPAVVNVKVGPDSFPLVAEELRNWETPPRFWWRDDDTRENTRSFRRMLAWSKQLELPGMLSVIAGRTPPAVPEKLAAHPQLRPVQHGWMHKNYEPKGTLKSEFGRSRSCEEARDDIISGFRRMQELFGADGFLPVFVPPFNTFAAKHLAVIEEVGFRGLSTIERYRRRRKTPPGQKPKPFDVVNIHVDIMSYEGVRPTPIHPSNLDAQIVKALKHVRAGAEVGREPVGLLSHHGDVYDDETWTLIGSLVEATRRRGCEWLAPLSVFPEKRPAKGRFGLKLAAPSAALEAVRGWLATRR